MKTRIIVSLSLLPLLVIVLLVLPGLYTAILVSLLAALAAYELLWGTGLVKHPRLIAYSAVMAAFISMWSYFAFSYVWVLLAVMLFTGVLFAEMMFSKSKLSFEKLAVCVVAGLVIPFLLSSLLRLRAMEYGKFYLLVPFIVAFMSDSAAYFAGKYLGKHKLAPTISPKKTVEGVIGGVLGAVLGMVIYGTILLFFHFRVNYLYGLLYGVVGSLGAVFGDLCFSAVKRQVGIKDYGKLIPGHGGVLDRFDSMVIVAPLMELLVLTLTFAVK